MKLAFMVAAWLIGVLIGLETRTPLAPLLLLLGGSVTLGLAMRLRSLPVFPAVLALLLLLGAWRADVAPGLSLDRKSTRLNSSHVVISYAVFCLQK